MKLDHYPRNDVVALIAAVLLGADTIGGYLYELDKSISHFGGNYTNMTHEEAIAEARTLVEKAST